MQSFQFQGENSNIQNINDIDTNLNDHPNSLNENPNLTHNLTHNNSNSKLDLLEMQDGHTLWKSLWNISISSNSPLGRFCHSCGYYKENLIFFGGLMPDAVLANECYLYHIPSAKWEHKKINISNTKLDSISAHALIIFEEHNEAILIGGSATSFSDIFVLDLVEWEWRKQRAITLEKLEIEDDMETGYYRNSENVDSENGVRIITKSVYPNPRTQHSTVQYGDNIIMFGGSGTNNDKLDDLWIFNRTRYEWEKPVTTGHKPEKRWGHDSARIGEYMYIFGGVVKSEKSPVQQMSDELFRFHIPTRTWSFIEWQQSFPIPVPRAAHTLSAFEDKLIILWGGDNNRYMKDLCVIDTNTFQVGRISFSSPIPRCSHTATVVDSFLYVLGGCSMESGYPRVYKDLYVVSLRAVIQRLKFPSIAYSNSQYRVLPNPHWFSHVRSEVVVDSITNSNNNNNYMKTQSNKEIEKEIISQRAHYESQYYMSTGAKVITKWLNTLRLGVYAPNFIREEIELEILHTLTDEDLINIGIDKLGHRRKIILEAQKFNQPEITNIINNQPQIDYGILLENINLNTSHLIQVTNTLIKSVDILSTINLRLQSHQAPSQTSIPTNNYIPNGMSNNTSHGKYVHRRRKSIKGNSKQISSNSNLNNYGSHYNEFNNQVHLKEENAQLIKNHSSEPTYENEQHFLKNNSNYEALVNNENFEQQFIDSDIENIENINDFISQDPSLKGLSWYEISVRDEELINRD